MWTNWNTEIINDFLVKVAADIGKDHTLSDLKDLPSIIKIKKQNRQITFDFFHDDWWCL